MSELNIAVQCTRCKNKHSHAERIPKPDRKMEGLSNLVCPRCGCHSYYDLTPWFAWCWASGLIEFGPNIPLDTKDGAGCVAFATGPRAFLIGIVQAAARMSYSGQPLVPGVPEAESDDAGIEAVITWMNFFAKGNGKRSRNGVVFGVIQP